VRVQPVNGSILTTSAFGTCLYLGPGGERCTEPAGADGFCSRHASDAEPAPKKPAMRRFHSVWTLLALLAPLLARLWHEVARWFHHH